MTAHQTKPNMVLVVPDRSWWRSAIAKADGRGDAAIAGVEVDNGARVALRDGMRNIAACRDMAGKVQLHAAGRVTDRKARLLPHRRVDPLQRKHSGAIQNSPIRAEMDPWQEPSQHCSAEFQATSHPASGKRALNRRIANPPLSFLTRDAG